MICKIQRNASTRYFQSEVVADLTGRNVKDRMFDQGMIS